MLSWLNTIKSRYLNEIIFLKKNISNRNLNLLCIQINPPHEFLTSKVVTSADSKDFQTLLASFRASGGMLKKKAKSKFIIGKLNRNKSFFAFFFSEQNK